MKDEELFKAWKSEQYKDQSTEEKMEFVEHLHTFPKHFEKTFLAGLKAGRPQWHKANEIQCYEDIPNDKNKLYVWVVNIAKFEKDKPILETRVGSCDELEYDIMAYHLIKWCEITKE